MWLNSGLEQHRQSTFEDFGKCLNPLKLTVEAPNPKFSEEGHQFNRQNRRFRPAQHFVG
jgi:hypothetical protein